MMKSVLFVCVENSCRSQMAEGFAREHGAGVVDATGAGSRPSGVVNPKAIAAMKEAGIDISGHQSKGFDALPARVWDAVVTMGCGDACPFIPARRRIDWDLPDPAQMPPAEFNKVRDEIRRRVIDLIEDLKKE
jgi:protein-tyrosine-phosphatase